MKTEYDELKLRLIRALDFKEMLVAFVTAIEFLNSKFDPAIDN